MKIALLTCIYPGAEGFVSDFISSIAGQSFKDFDLVVLNDGILECNRLFESIPMNVHVLDVEGTPARIRKTGIEWISRNGFDFIIFADIDDLFDANRVEQSVFLLKNHIMVFNELVMFGSGVTVQKPLYSEYFQDGYSISFDSILNSNCLGLSNTAAHVDPVFEASLKTSNETIAFDWALFTRLLAEGETALYTSKTRTYYRQHGNNIATIWNLSDKDIRRGVTVKARHYRAVEDLSTVFRNLAVQFSKLDAKIANEPAFADLYYSAIRATSSVSPLWWEKIRTAEELNL